MRIFIDLTSIHDELSGIERFALNIAKSMIKNDKNKIKIENFLRQIFKNVEISIVLV